MCPYIKNENNRRLELQNALPAQNAGELNYQIFYHVKHSLTPNDILIIAFVENFLGKHPNYQKYNDMVGCLVLCATEIERRLGKKVTILSDLVIHYRKDIADYEDEKIIENGDVE